MYGRIIMLLLAGANLASAHGQDTECPVCLDQLVPRKTVSPPCAHNICETCYDGIFTHQAEPSCPLCRASYTEIVPPDPIPEPRIRPRRRQRHRPGDTFDWWGILLIILELIAGVLGVRR